MKPDQLQEIRASVLRQIKGLENELANAPEMECAAMPDPCDRATGETSRSIAAVLNAASCSRLRSLRDALARIDAGQFGFCVECEEDIGVQRLKAMPTASLCIECKRVHEEEQERRELSA